MTKKQLEELGFTSSGSFWVKPLYRSDGNFIDDYLCEFQISKLKGLSQSEFVKKVYEIGVRNGREYGANELRSSLKDLLDI